MKKILALLLSFVCFGFICPTFAKVKDEIITPQTQLQKRQYQTKQYSNVKKDVLMKAMLNVLQDEGFIVNNANPLSTSLYIIEYFNVSDIVLFTQ